MKRLTALSVLFFGFVVGSGCSQPPADNGPSVFDISGYNMDGSWVGDVELVTHDSTGVTRDTGRSRLLILSYGPAVQALGIPMLSLSDKLATDLDYEDPYDVNFNYYSRTTVTGELTKESGFFAVRIEVHNENGVGWIEQDWSFTNLQPILRDQPPNGVATLTAADLLGGEMRFFDHTAP